MVYVQPYIIYSMPCHGRFKRVSGLKEQALAVPCSAARCSAVRYSVLHHAWYNVHVYYIMHVV